MDTEAPEVVSAERRALEAHIVARAWQDATFRSELLADPKAVLARELKARFPALPALPADLAVYVHEETRQALHLVLPLKPGEFVEGELSESELRTVAGA